MALIAFVVPVLLGFGVAAVATPAGVSGSFLLLPLQLSVLGIATPSSSATNLLFNVVSTPGGIWRYRQQGQLHRRLAYLVAAGTLPGVAAGALLRVTVFADPAVFAKFVGAVLLILGPWLLLEVGRPPRATAASHDARSYRPLVVLSVALTVGLLGGIYGIGGAALITPFLIVVERLAVKAVAGAALLATLVTSIGGLTIYQTLALTEIAPTAAPDWTLGLLFGLGGLGGSYLGARLQPLLPERVVKAVLGLGLTGLAVSYLV